MSFTAFNAAFHICVSRVSVFAMAASMLASHSAEAGWKYYNTKDSMTDKVSVSIMTTSDDGYGIALKRTDDGSVHLLAITPSSSPPFDRNNGFMARVDDKKAELFSDSVELYGIAKKYGAQNLNAPYAITPHMAGFLVWGGEKPIPEENFISQMMNGSQIKFRVYFADGTNAEFAVSLSGAAEAIRQLIE